MAPGRFFSDVALAEAYLSALLFPEQARRIQKLSRVLLFAQRGALAVLACVYAVDLYDTWLKGADYFHVLGIDYIVGNATYMASCGVAIATRQPASHVTLW